MLVHWRSNLGDPGLSHPGPSVRSVRRFAARVPRRRRGTSAVSVRGRCGVGGNGALHVEVPGTAHYERSARARTERGEPQAGQRNCLIMHSFVTLVVEWELEVDGPRLVEGCHHRLSSGQAVHFPDLPGSLPETPQIKCFGIRRVDAADRIDRQVYFRRTP